MGFQKQFVSWYQLKWDEYCRSKISCQKNLPRMPELQLPSQKTHKCMAQMWLVALLIKIRSLFCMLSCHASLLRQHGTVLVYKEIKFWWHNNDFIIRPYNIMHACITIMLRSLYTKANIHNSGLLFVKKSVWYCVDFSLCKLHHLLILNHCYPTIPQPSLCTVVV